MKKSSVKIDDLYRIKYLREIALSPDSGKIAYTVEWMDKKQNKYFSNLYVVGTDRTTRHFIRGNKNMKNPKWSPNGRFISFVTTDKDKENIWAIPTDGGEAYQLTDAEGFFGDYQWTPDSRYLICEFTERKIDKERIPDKDKPPLYYHITKPLYKYDCEGILPDEKPHIWKINAKTGRMKQLTFGPNGDREPNVSADGSQIAFISNRNKNYEEKILYDDLYVVDINGKKESLVKTPAGPKTNPVFSPDSRNIVYVGREYPEEFVGWRTYYLWLLPLRGGKAVNITAKFDGAVYDANIDDLGNYARTYLKFSKDGKSIYFNGSDYGGVAIYKADVAKHDVQKITGSNERIYAYDYDGVNTFALAISNPTDPGNLYRYDKGSRSKLTDLNNKYFLSRKFAIPGEFKWRGYNNDEIQGWVLKPPDFNKNKKYPFIVQIHGGPHMAYGNSFFHEFQMLAAQGYVVFFSNPHGSIGYGEKFARALHLRWGIPDYVDLMKAIRLLLTNKFIDRKRMAVMGGSYGGFMTNWIIGHTNIFKAAVTMRSVVNMLSFFSTDFGFYLPKEFKGNWWEKNNFDYYWSMSPLKYVKKIKTPLLIVHSEQDHRCPITQAEELYVALKILKRPVEMVRFPVECHELSRHGSPRRREKRLEFILKFVNKHLKNRKAEDKAAR